MGYCRKHNIRWRDDYLRDEEFRCPECELDDDDEDEEEEDQEEEDDD